MYLNYRLNLTCQPAHRRLPPAVTGCPASRVSFWESEADAARNADGASAGAGVAICSTCWPGSIGAEVRCGTVATHGFNRKVLAVRLRHAVRALALAPDRDLARDDDHVEARGAMTVCHALAASR